MGGNIPLLPFEEKLLILQFRIFFEAFPAERDTGLFFDELPAAFDLRLAPFLDQRVVILHRLRHRVQRPVQEPVLDDGCGNGRVAGLVGGHETGCRVRIVIHDADTGFRLTHGTGVRRQAEGLDGVDVVEDRIRVDVAGDEVRDHLQRDIDEAAVPERVEDAAGHGLVVKDRLFPELGLFPVVEPEVSGKHAHELFDRGISHAAVVPRRRAQCGAAHAFHAAVIPVEDRDVGLSDPAVPPEAFEEGQRFFGGQDVADHGAVRVAPDAGEII